MPRFLAFADHSRRFGPASPAGRPEEVPFSAAGHNVSVQVFAFLHTLPPRSYPRSTAFTSTSLSGLLTQLGFLTDTSTSPARPAQPNSATPLFRPSSRPILGESPTLTIGSLSYFSLSSPASLHALYTTGSHCCRLSLIFQPPSLVGQPRSFHTPNTTGTFHSAESHNPSLFIWSSSFTHTVAGSQPTRRIPQCRRLAFLVSPTRCCWDAYTHLLGFLLRHTLLSRHTFRYHLISCRWTLALLEQIGVHLVSTPIHPAASSRLTCFSSQCPTILLTILFLDLTSTAVDRQELRAKSRGSPGQSRLFTRRPPASLSSLSTCLSC